MHLFTKILDVIFPPRTTERLVRDADADSLIARMKPITLKEGVALLPYRDPLVHACIVEAKFYGNKKAQELLGSVLAFHLKEASGYTLVPVPLSGTRRRERGYNQVEEVCKPLPVACLLRRTRDTLPQTSLGGEARRRNMEGAFAVEGSVDPTYLYIVVDDVITTGATLASAVQALQGASAHSVRSITLAYSGV